MTAKLIQVIEVKSVKGQGTDNDPKRTLLQYYSVNGTLLAENDTLLPTATVHDLNNLMAGNNATT